jgi:molybdopterin synthase sulfur carrier subunit
MPTVFIPTQLRDLTGGTAQLEVPGANVGQVVAALEVHFPGIRARLFRDGTIIPGFALSVDGALVSKGLLSPVGPKSEVHFLPAFGGG